MVKLAKALIGGRALIIVGIGMAMIASLGGAKPPPKVQSRERIVNECLDWILAEGMAARARKESITWDELEARVAIRMKVRRVRVWENPK